MGLIDAFESLGKALTGGQETGGNLEKTNREYMDEVMEFCENVDAMTPGQRCFIAGYLQALEDMAAKTNN